MNRLLVMEDWKDDRDVGQRIQSLQAERRRLVELLQQRRRTLCGPQIPRPANPSARRVSLDGWGKFLKRIARAIQTPAGGGGMVAKAVPRGWSVVDKAASSSGSLFEGREQQG